MYSLRKIHYLGKTSAYLRANIQDIYYSKVLCFDFSYISGTLYNTASSPALQNRESVDGGFEPRAVATLALAARCSEPLG